MREGVRNVVWNQNTGRRRGQGKTVLCRVDINEPIDWAAGGLKNITRVKACVPTIKELSDKGAKLRVLIFEISLTETIFVEIVCE